MRQQERHYKKDKNGTMPDALDVVKMGKMWNMY